MSRVTLPQKVVVFRSGVRYYIDEARANKLLETIRGHDCPKFVEIDGDSLAVSDISMVVSPSKIEDLDKQRRGMWQCRHGNWQGRNVTQCSCHWSKSLTAKNMPDLSGDYYDKHKPNK